MTSGRRKRIYGSRIDFRSLSCAPSSELGVVYLFGVLHDVFDLKIESIQAGFPDCIARRQISPDRWEELRIEFEYNSKAFVQHKHDPAQVDLIVCWIHDWAECPDCIEVIELSTRIKQLEEIAVENRDTQKLTAYQEFAREKRLEGLSFAQIAELWRGQKRKKRTAQAKNGLEISEWQRFLRKAISEGKSFAEAAKLWRESKQKKS
jgi:hypothetical protein